MRVFSRLSSVLVAALGVAILLAPPARAQVSLTTLGTPYTQSFDSLPASGSATWTNNSNIPGWFHARTGTGTTIVANDGSSNAGNLYSYGTGTATDRALGSLGSGNAAIGNLFWGVRLQNNTGATITTLNVSYTGEQWRNSAAAAQTVAFSYLVGSPTVTGSLAEFQAAGVPVTSLDFTSPITGGAAGALNGNLAANRVALTFSITGLSIPNGTEVMLRWSDPDHTGADHGLSIDDFSVTPQGGTPTLNIGDATVAEGDPPGTTTFTFAVTLTAPTGGGVTFNIATSDGTAQDDNPVTEDNDYVAQSLSGQSIPGGSTGPYNFNVTVNRDLVAEPNETFFVNVTSIVGANAGDTLGQGTINNDDVTVVFIHDVQGNGSATPIPGASVTVEGVVVGNFQGTSRLKGFFLQEEDADADADPATSEGVFVFCDTCPTAVAEGQRVRATGTVSEFFNMTEITASTAGSVIVTDAANHLAEVTPSPVDLPVVGDVNAFYETREGMLVTFVDTLTVSEYFELARFGHLELFEGGRPLTFTEMSPPSVAGLTAHLDNLDRRRVILDDDNDASNVSLTQPDGSQFIFHPRANGGFSVGTQGVDFFRGGDLVNGLTGVLHWSFAGVTGTDAWRIRPVNATPATFTVANPRPATPPAVGGAIKAVGMNLLNYFTTIDTTSSSSSGPCGPSGTQDCRGADSNAELIRQRERASIVICSLNADVYGFAELENTTATGTITDLVGAVNTLCGGAHPYTFVNTGGTLGTDAIRVELIYRTGVLSPVGSPLVDLDPVHNRPPTAQTFDVVDAANPAFGERFTVIPNHFKSKGSCPGSGADADAGDGQSCWNATRVAQANRLLTWISGTVLPAAGDPDVLLLGDFNSNAQEDPVTAITGGGYTDLASALLGPTAYSYLFDAQLGHLDYAFASSSLLPQVTGVGNWHINADEASLFDYNDEVKDTGEAAFEEKPDGSALAPPRVLFQPASPWRAADHDPVIVGLFQVADLSITKTDGVTTAVPGGSVTYTITASNAGPDPVTGGTVADTFPAVLTCTWTCVGAGGGTCTASGGGNINDTVNLPAGGSVTYTASCSINTSATGTLSNTATVSSGAASDPNTGNNSATDTDTLTPQADLSITKTDGVTTATPGGSVTYTITASNAGPSNAPGSTVSDTFPASLTCTWTCVGAGGGTCTASGSGNISDTANLPAGGSVTYTASCTVSASATGTLSNTATVAAPAGVTDPTPGNNSATDTDTLTPQADLSITKTDGVTTATSGGSVTYTVTASNAGPSNAPGSTVSDTFPASLTCTWTCVGAGGGTCTASGSGNISDTANLPAGGSVTYTASCTVSASATGTLSNTATVAAPAGVTDPTPGNNSATDTDTISPTGDYFFGTPCRAVDTRSGAPLQNGVPRTFALHGVCGIPVTAKAVVINVTVVSATGNGDLTVYAADATPPTITLMPFRANITRGQFFITPISLDAAGEVAIEASVAGNGTVHVLIDVMGYFE